MRNKLATTILTALLYTQGLLGFAGLTTVVLKDWMLSQPAYAVDIQPVEE